MDSDFQWTLFVGMCALVGGFMYIMWNVLKD